jgi:hypothetical protein
MASIVVAVVRTRTVAIAAPIEWVTRQSIQADEGDEPRFSRKRDTRTGGFMRKRQSRGRRIGLAAIMGIAVIGVFIGSEFGHLLMIRGRLMGCRSASDVRHRLGLPRHEYRNPDKSEGSITHAAPHRRGVNIDYDTLDVYPARNWFGPPTYVGVYFKDGVVVHICDFAM